MARDGDQIESNVISVEFDESAPRAVVQAMLDQADNAEQVMAVMITKDKELMLYHNAFSHKDLAYLHQMLAMYVSDVLRNGDEP